MRELPKTLYSRLHGLTAIVTGGANGIGAKTVSLLRRCGANVVIADLASSRQFASSLIDSMGTEHRDHLRFIATDITKWADVKKLFRETQQSYGGPHLVVANAGIMESRDVLDLNDTEEDDELREPLEAYQVFDVNLKGTFNSEYPVSRSERILTVVALKYALFSMKSNGTLLPSAPHKGSIVLVSSTSGYFGGSAVSGYVSSKHGVVGLVRSSQAVANRIGVRVNGVAPFFTPSHMTASYATEWVSAGLKTNSTEGVALCIVKCLADPTQQGNCSLVGSAGIE